MSSVGCFVINVLQSLVFFFFFFFLQIPYISESEKIVIITIKPLSVTNTTEVIRG